MLHGWAAHGSVREHNMSAEQDGLNQSSNPSFNPAVTPLCQGAQGLACGTDVTSTYTHVTCYCTAV